jgi:hypothetical protein
MLIGDPDVVEPQAGAAELELSALLVRKINQSSPSIGVTGELGKQRSFGLIPDNLGDYGPS